MFDLESILAALRSDSPWESMRHVVDRVLDRGVRLADARLGLYAWAPKVEDCTDLSEDQVDAFFDTVDILGGMCRPEYLFVERDAPTMAAGSIPTATQVSTLQPSLAPVM
jgi:hypothetical protein